MLSRLLRTKQWTKNLSIFACLLFAGKFLEAGAVLSSLVGFGVLCALTGAVYIINDIKDLEEDREHPTKCTRPLCSGEIGVTAATCIAVIFALSSITGAFVLDRGFGFVLLAYCFLNVLYSFFLKKMVILDVFCIATGFFLRVLGGAYIIHITPSPWLLMCAFLVSIFLALLKRRHELITLGHEAGNHRKVLNDYSARFLDQMVGVVTAVTILSYMLWTVESANIQKYGIQLLITFPFVVYGMFRYLYLVHKKNGGGDPTELIFRDFPLIVTVSLWLVVLLFIMHKSLIILEIGNLLLR